MAYVMGDTGVADGFEGLGRRGRRRVVPPPPPPPPPVEGPDELGDGLEARRARGFTRFARSGVMLGPAGVIAAKQRAEQRRKAQERRRMQGMKNPAYVGYLKAYVGPEGLADYLGADGLDAYLEGLGKKSIIPKKIRKSAAGKYITKHRKAFEIVGAAIAGVVGAIVVGPAIIAGAGKLLGIAPSGVTKALSTANKLRAAAGMGPISPTDLANKLKARAQQRAAAGLPAETIDQATAAIATEVAPAQPNELVTPAQADAQLVTAVKAGAITPAQASEIGRATSGTGVVEGGEEEGAEGGTAPGTAVTGQLVGGTKAKAGTLFGLPKPVVYAGGAIAATVAALAIFRRKRSR